MADDETGRAPAGGNVAQRALNAERVDEAIRMRARGAHWGEVSASCGYSSPAAALQAVGAAMAAATQRAEMTADQMRDEAQLRLESLLSSAMSMIGEQAHYDEDGNVADDRAVRLRAVDEARRVVLDIAKLQRLDKAKDEADSDSSGIRIIGIRVEDIL